MGRGTYLEGDTTSLSALKKLTHLDLFGNMELTGNLNEALGGAPGMEYLNLMSTCTQVDLNVFEAGVTGDATVVCSMDKLNKLQLVGSGASCEELVVMDDALGYTVPCLDTCSIIS